MLVVHFLLTVSYIFIIIECKMMPFIVGGEVAQITDFPHSAHIGTQCPDETKEYMLSWVCGSSILNQNVILTAGHCVYGCFEDTLITISVGVDYKIENGVTTGHSTLVHEDYDVKTLSNDIGLVRVTMPLKFSENISRVALLKNPPYKEEALVAGWGLTEEGANETSPILRYTKQYVWDTKDCVELFKLLPEGTFCAQNIDTSSYTINGDSGSALIVQGYIQIGIVSSRHTELSLSVSIYTDTGYFYEWIQKNTQKIICED